MVGVVGAGAVGSGLPRTSRLRKRREFVRVQGAPAARVRGQDFLLLAAWASSGEVACRGAPERPAAVLERAAPCRLGIVASKRVGCAVRRNRAKRLLREAFRRLGSRAPAGVDLVAVAHPSLADRHAREVEAQLERMLGRLRRELGSPRGVESAPRPAPSGAGDRTRASS